MNYPFEELIEGKSFTVPVESVNELELLNIIAQANIQYGKQFSLIKHEEVFEIGLEIPFLNVSIVTSSPTMLSKIAGKSSKYPFEKLDVGQSFTVPVEDGVESSLRVQCSTYGKKHSKVFRCVKHKSQGLLEVGRIS